MQIISGSNHREKWANCRHEHKVVFKVIGILTPRKLRVAAVRIN